MEIAIDGIFQTYETATALNAEIDDELPYNDYYEYFGPDFRLHITFGDSSWDCDFAHYHRPTNMENANTRDYLEKCKSQVIGNLRQIQGAPSVQMQRQSNARMLLSI